jgi:hypothetical protein
MAIKFSTGLRDQILGLQATIEAILTDGIDSTAFAFDGTAETITDSNSGFVTAGFVAGHIVTVNGSTGNDTMTGVKIKTVAAGTLTFDTDAVIADEADAPTGTTIAAAKGGSLKDIMKNGCLWIYSGSQPSDADQSMTGTALVKITVGSGAFSALSETNGLEFDDYGGGYIEKCADETWSGVVLATGTAGYFVFVANGTDALGASTTLPRIMGSVGTSGADLNLATTSLVVSRTQTIDTFKITLPAYYGA